MTKQTCLPCVFCVQGLHSWLGQSILGSLKIFMEMTVHPRHTFSLKLVEVRCRVIQIGARARPLSGFKTLNIWNHSYSFSELCSRKGFSLAWECLPSELMFFWFSLSTNPSSLLNAVTKSSKEKDAAISSAGINEASQFPSFFIK